MDGVTCSEAVCNEHLKWRVCGFSVLVPWRRMVTNIWRGSAVVHCVLLNTPLMTVPYRIRCKVALGQCKWHQIWYFRFDFWKSETYRRRVWLQYQYVLQCHNDGIFISKVREIEEEVRQAHCMKQISCLPPGKCEHSRTSPNCNWKLGFHSWQVCTWRCNGQLVRNIQEAANVSKFQRWTRHAFLERMHRTLQRQLGRKFLEYATV